MQKLGLKQFLQHKLSPQQIQFIKLLQVSTAKLESRIKEELEANPALDEGKIHEAPPDTDVDDPASSTEENIDLDNYLHDDSQNISHYRANNKPNYGEQQEITIAASTSLQESLIRQLGFLGLNEHQNTLGKQLIGSIGEDGYMRRELDAISNDLLFAQNLQVDVKEIEEVLKKIQQFDPAGIGARNLRECLLIQLDRMDDRKAPAIKVAKRILTHCHNEFFKKQYAKIQKKLGYSHEGDIKNAINVIVRLNPKPGSGMDLGIAKNQYIIPDFILSGRENKLKLSLNAKNAPELKISRSYLEMLDAYSGSKQNKKLKEVASFVKQKLDSAKWFIDAIQQRQHTLLKTMQAIVDFQFEYFMEGDDSKLKPMILKDIAKMIDMDISTVSRVVSSKSVQTNFGVFPLKHFFSEGISSSNGEEVSAHEVRRAITNLVEEEAKDNPLSDEKIEKFLRNKGYHIARRTIAKYRQQLKIPVARLRRKLL